MLRPRQRPILPRGKRRESSMRIQDRMESLRGSAMLMRAAAYGRAAASLAAPGAGRPKPPDPRSNAMPSRLGDVMQAAAFGRGVTYPAVPGATRLSLQARDDEDWCLGRASDLSCPAGGGAPEASLAGCGCRSRCTGLSGPPRSCRSWVHRATALRAPKPVCAGCIGCIRCAARAEALLRGGTHPGLAARVQAGVHRVYQRPR
jgi:hypothetical protein